jgi:hypothetical protein
MSFSEFAEYCFSVLYATLPAQFVSLPSDDHANSGESTLLVIAAEQILRNVLLSTDVFPSATVVDF